MYQPTQQKQVDTTALVFDYLFLCSVPLVQSTSVEYLKVFGTPTVGNADIDRELNNQWVKSYISIAKMVSYFKEGVPIKVLKYTDTKQIYDYISQHLAAWRVQLEQGINIGDAPIDDLIAMDEFAQIVYDEAKYQFTRETVTSIMARRMSEVVALNKDNFFKPSVAASLKESQPQDSIRVNAIEDDPYPKRESLADLLTTRSFGGRIY